MSFVITFFVLFFLDQFVVHFESVIPDKYVEKLDSGKGWQKKQLKVRR